MYDIYECIYMNDPLQNKEIIKYVPEKGVGK